MWRSQVLLARYGGHSGGAADEVADPPLQCQRISWQGGTAAFAAYLRSIADREVHFGTMVAGNSGRVAGGCGNTIDYRFENIYAGHPTQEENIVSNWVLTMEALSGSDRRSREQLFKQLCHTTDDGKLRPRWGLMVPQGKDTTTYQGKVYTEARPSDYEEAWEVPDAVLSADSSGTGASYETTLVFVAGPNVGMRGRPDGSMARTFNSHMQNSYPSFREGVKCAVRAGLNKMRECQCSVALVAGVSTGIYAGPLFRTRINAEFTSIVDEILSEEPMASSLRLVYYVVLGRAGNDDSVDRRVLSKLREQISSLSHA